MYTTVLKSLIAALACIIIVNKNHAQNPTTYNSIEITLDDTPDDIIAKASCIAPSQRQLAALENEFIAFIHFGPNTFTRQEWGTGKEDPGIFDLHELDTDQWVEALKSAGMKMVILTVKHHDGFVLWQSRYTDHGIMSTGFENGHGDVLRELSRSCGKYGMKLGIYLSPADLYQIESPQGLYGNGSSKTLRHIPGKVDGRPFADKRGFDFVVDDYNEYFLNQLFELLTEYGPIHEVWFDGANPKKKGGQTYDYDAWKTVIRCLAPDAVIFEGGDIRWCGNESGATRITEFNVRPEPFPDEHDQSVPFAIRGTADRESLMNARRLLYRQAETNTSIREGWFYRDEDHQRVRSADDVFDIYERSVGGNSTFLLNVPPNRDGRLSDEDVDVLREVGRRISDTYGKCAALGADTPEALTDGDILTSVDISTPVTVALCTPSRINRIVLQEAIMTHGERIEGIVAEVFSAGMWHKVAEATNVGYKRILRFPEIEAADSVRISVTASRATPALSALSAHYYESHPPRLCMSRDSTGRVVIDAATDNFNWKPSGINSSALLNDGMEIHYTLDGTSPTTVSPLYSAPLIAIPGHIRAVAYVGGRRGPELRDIVMRSDTTVIDTEPLTIDLGEIVPITAIAYTPDQGKDQGQFITSAVVETSSDGINWIETARLNHGNIVNDPSRRICYLDNSIKTRYVRFNRLRCVATDTEASLTPSEIGIF